MPGPVTVASLAAAAFGAGVVDAIAGGGGLVTLPALLAAGLPPPLALGTNKGQAVFGATASAASFWRRRAVDRERAPVAFVAGFGGSWLGAHAVLRVPPGLLRVVVIALLLVAAAVVLARHASLGPATAGPPVAAGSPRRRGLATLVIALLLGGYDGFFGPGVGSMLVIAFATVCADPLTRASGNAKVVNLASNLAAIIYFATQGAVVWAVALPMAAANALGAATGAHLAIRRGDRLIRAVVLLVVLAVVVKLAADLARGR